MKKLMNIIDAMTRLPVVVGPDKTIFDSIKLMLKGKVGSLVVQENGILKGIVTEKDFVEKVIVEGLNPKKTKIKSIMNIKVITVSPDLDIMEAIKLMTNNNVRRLPVVDKNNKLLGLVTVNDILRVQPQLFELVLDKSILFSSKRDYVDSRCDKCSIHGLVKSINGKFLCWECERNERVINYLR